MSSLTRTNIRDVFTKFCNTHGVSVQLQKQDDHYFYYNWPNHRELILSGPIIGVRNYSSVIIEQPGRPDIKANVDTDEQLNDFLLTNLSGMNMKTRIQTHRQTSQLTECMRTLHSRITMLERHLS